MVYCARELRYSVGGRFQWNTQHAFRLNTWRSAIWSKHNETMTTYKERGKVRPLNCFIYAIREEWRRTFTLLPSSPLVYCTFCVGGVAIQLCPFYYHQNLIPHHRHFANSDKGHYRVTLETIHQYKIGK